MYSKVSNKAIVRGTYWTATSTLVTAIAQILRLSILTIYLEKGDFGVVAILTLVLGLTYTFGDLGFSSAIMHQKNLTRIEFCSLYWIQLFIYVIIYFLIVICSGYVAIYFKQPLIEILLPITMIDLLLHGIGRLYETLLQKDFQFKILAIRNIIASTLSLILAIVLAANKFGVYSLIFSTLFQTSLLNLWNFIAGQRHIRIAFVLSINGIKELASIGLWQTATQIADYISAKIDILIIGKYLGVVDLGIYNLVKELIMKVVLVINSIANRIALPVFAEIQEDIGAIINQFNRMIKVLSFINFPICTIIGALSSIVISILYGKDYSEAIPILAILSIWGMMLCICNPIGSVAIAKGKTYLLFEYTVLRIIVTIPVIFLLSKYGLISISIGSVILSVIMLFLIWYFEIWRIIRVRFVAFLQLFIKSFIVSIVLGIIGFYFIYNNYLGVVSLWETILFYAAPFILIYLSVFYLINRRDLIQISGLIFKR